MTPDPHAARYEVCLYVITGLVEARSGLTEIEGVIEASDLPEEKRSMLWLFARSLRSLRRSGSRVRLPYPPARPEVGESLLAITGGGRP